MSSPLLILSDPVANSLLTNLSAPDILTLQTAISDSLVAFSTSPERSLQPPSSSITRPEGSKILFRPFTSPSSVGAKIIVDPAPNFPSGPRGPLRGVLALCDSTGQPTGLVDASAVTGIRTALSALIPLNWRKQVAKVLIFGAGVQALWHLRLALALRGREVREVVVVNRSMERARELVRKVREEDERNGWVEGGVRIDCLDPARDGYEERLGEVLKAADVVFCTVPSREPLFAATRIATTGGDRIRKGPLITAVGSWMADMMELDPALLQELVNHPQGFHPRVPDGGSGGVIIVDDAPSALQHAGEVVHGGISKEALVEIGEILEMQKRDTPDPRRQRAEWLREGLLVYKSVGVSVTDLVAGETMLALARKQGVGVMVPGFGNPS